VNISNKTGLVGFLLALSAFGLTSTAQAASDGNRGWGNSRVGGWVDGRGGSFVNARPWRNGWSDGGGFFNSRPRWGNGGGFLNRW